MRFWFQCRARLVTGLVGVLAACGGKAGSNEGTAGSAGSAGSVATSGAGGALSQGGTASAGAAGSAMGGMAHGGASSMAGSAGSGGRGGSSGAGGVATSGSAGVGGASGGVGAGGDAPTPAALVPTVATFCAAARNCCAKQGEPAMLDDCESAFATKNSIAGSLARGALTVDATALAACRAAYEAAATSCEENSVLSACKGVTTGTVVEGAPCHYGTECAAKPGPNTCLITTNGSDVGVCKAVPHAAAGESCLFTCRAGDDCRSTTYGSATGSVALCFEDEGLYCDIESQHCKALLPLGAACSTDDQCGINAFCSTTCQKRGNVGEACLPCLASLTCVNDKCVSPPFASFSTCEGRSLGPY